MYSDNPGRRLTTTLNQEKTIKSIKYEDLNSKFLMTITKMILTYGDVQRYRHDVIVKHRERQEIGDQRVQSDVAVFADVRSPIRSFLHYKLHHARQHYFNQQQHHEYNNMFINRSVNEIRRWLSFIREIGWNCSILLFSRGEFVASDLWIQRQFRVLSGVNRASYNMIRVFQSWSTK